MVREEWQERSVKDLMKIETGSRNTEDKQDDGQYPFFVRSQTVEHIDSFHYDCEAVLTAGDGVGTGKVFHYINGKFDAHQRVYIMSQFKEVLGKYFYYWFSKNFFAEVAKYTAKSSVDSVRRQMIADMVIPLPSSDEQRNIVSALSDIDLLILNLQKLIRKKKDIRQGTMQVLLTGEKRLNGYLKKWKEYKLKNISSIQDGTHGTFKRTDNGYMLLSAKNVFNNHLVLSDEESFISEDDYYSIVSNGYPQKGDILMSCVGTIGRCCIYDAKEKAAFQRSVTFIRCNSTCSNRFVSYVLQTEDVFKQLTAAASASAQAGIYLGALNEIEIRIPDDLKEQDEIASIINDMNEEIDVLEEKLSKYQKVKQGMMEELLTGKVRLM